jgi:hypothetical protein
VSRHPVGTIPAASRKSAVRGENCAKRFFGRPIPIPTDRCRSDPNRRTVRPNLDYRPGSASARTGGHHTPGQRRTSIRSRGTDLRSRRATSVGQSTGKAGAPRGCPKGTTSETCVRQFGRGKRAEVYFVRERFSNDRLRSEVVGETACVAVWRSRAAQRQRTTNKPGVQTTRACSW